MIDEDYLTPGNTVYYNGKYNKEFEVVEKEKSLYAVAYNGSLSEIHHINHHNCFEFFKTPEDLINMVALNMQSELNMFKNEYGVE